MLETAVEFMERSIRTNPDYSVTLILRAGLAMVGRSEDSSDSVRRLRTLEPTTTVDLFSARNRYGES